MKKVFVFLGSAIVAILFTGCNNNSEKTIKLHTDYYQYIMPFDKQDKEIVECLNNRGLIVSNNELFLVMEQFKDRGLDEMFEQINVGIKYCKKRL